MPRCWKKILAALLAAACLGAVCPVAARAEDIAWLTYEEALPYYNFDTAVSNWCVNFGLDYAADYDAAKTAILAGTSRDLIVRLATYARDTGHGAGSLVVTNAFRPACYQEIIGLHDANANTGYFRNGLTWNGRSVTGFWWTAEQAPGWPAAYALDLSAYDLASLDLTYFYRAALRLWDNTWIGNYFARPGCSVHNSGLAMDVMSDWIGGDFSTSHTYNGRTYRMEDYGLYKPLQPNGWSAGESWHITCVRSILALGSYDAALSAGYEIDYGLYYNPVSRGWSMADGRGLYLGAGVTVIQLRLCQLGLLGQEYVTGYFCAATEAAVEAFQAQSGLTPDGVCGSGTLALLFPAETVPADGAAPAVTSAAVTAVTNKGFTIAAAASDDQRVNAFRVDTRAEGSDAWVTRYYNADKTGGGALDIDIWAEGTYETRLYAADKAGNLSDAVGLGSVFVDMTAPRFRRLTVSGITEAGFTLTCEGEDATGTAEFAVVLTPETGEARETRLTADSAGRAVFALSPGAGSWTVTVSARDTVGNEGSYTFGWKYAGAASDLTVTYYGPAA